MTVNIKLDTHVLGFILMNLFGHDFIHDFNVISCRDRLLTVQKEFPTFLPSISGGTELYGGEEPDNDDFDLNEDDDDNEDDGYAYLDDYEEIKEFFENNQFESLQNTRINSFFTGALTRSKAKILQMVGHTMQQLKLYVLTCKPLEEQTGGRAERAETSFFDKFSEMVLGSEPTKVDTVPVIDNKINNKMDNIEVIDTPNYVSHHQSILFGINARINNRVMNDYYEETEEANNVLVNNCLFIMENVYLNLYNNNPTIDPYDLFESKYIEIMMILYVIDIDNNLDVSNNLFLILYYFINKNTLGEKEQTGGDDETDEIIEYYKNFINKLEENKDNGEDLKSIISTIDFNKLDSLTNKSEFKNIRVSAKKKNIIKYVKRIQSQILDNTSRRYKNVIKAIKSETNDVIDILNIIIEYYDNMQEKLNIKLNAQNNGKELTTENENAIQGILHTVSNKILDYFNDDDNSIIANMSDNNLKDLISYDMMLIEQVGNTELGNTKGASLSSFDKNLLKKFVEYMENETLPSTMRFVKNFDDIKKFAKDALTINNAINNSAYIKTKIIPKNKIICPYSSIIDAMGSFGSCIKPNNNQLEKGNLDFNIEDDNGNSYSGQLIVEKQNRIKVIYNVNYGNFSLPYVEIPLNMKDYNKTLYLSANNTLKRVLKQILIEWKKTGINEFNKWDVLYNDRIFEQLIRICSQKGIGDFFQEINSVASGGGYQNPIIGPRIGGMGDQPSGVRAAMLTYKGIDGIGDKVMAGFFSPNSDNNAIVLKNMDNKKRQMDNTNKTNTKKARRGGKKQTRKSGKKSM